MVSRPLEKRFGLFIRILTFSPSRIRNTGSAAAFYRLVLGAALLGPRPHLLEGPVLLEDAVLKDDDQLVLRLVRPAAGRHLDGPVLVLLLHQRQPSSLALLPRVCYRIWNIYKLQRR
jgi:hypothetical protein